MSSFVVKLRGLPWSCTVDDIKGFLEPVEPENGDEGVHLLLSNEGNFRGKFNGEALVELKSDEDLEEAVKKNKEHMGKRYVEVFEAKKGELDYRCGPDFHPDECIVKLRGLPYGSTKDDIEDFFKDLEIMPNGIMLSTDPRGKTTGEAFVQFKTVKMTEKALEKHKEHMGKRYIEVFKSNLEFMRRSCSNEDKPPSLFDCDIDNGFKGGNNRGNNFNNGPFNNNGPMGNNMNFMNNGGPMGNMGGPMNNNRFGGPMNNNNRFGGGPMNNGGFNGPMNNGGMNNGGGNNRMTPYDRNNRPNRFNNRDSDGPNVRGGKIVHMRGLPFRATEDDVIEFFQPLKAVNIEMGVGEDGRPSGKADVEFRNPADTADAMTRNKNNMQHRYIELFIDPAEGTCPAEEKVTVDGIDDKHIKELELSIDEMTAKLPPLKNFILPGGGQISSSLHVCRSVCRRAERSVSLVSQGNQVHPSVVAYINRLSDFLFMTSRLASQNEGHEDTIYRTPKQSLQFRP